MSYLKDQKETLREIAEAGGALNFRRPASNIGGISPTAAPAVSWEGAGLEIGDVVIYDPTAGVNVEYRKIMVAFNDATQDIRVSDEVLLSGDWMPVKKVSALRPNPNGVVIFYDIFVDHH